MFDSAHASGRWSAVRIATTTLLTALPVATTTMASARGANAGGTCTVPQSGNHYTGTSLAQILDVDGNVVFSVDVTNAGKRILVELP